MEYLRLKQEDKEKYKYSYDVEVEGNTTIEVVANNRTQAAKFVRDAGYEVRSVNFTG